jgi:hypothetical protein
MHLEMPSTKTLCRLFGNVLPIHPSFSPDLAPLYSTSVAHKGSTVKGKYFWHNSEIKAEVHRLVKRLSLHFFSAGIEHLGMTLGQIC